MPQEDFQREEIRGEIAYQDRNVQSKRILSFKIFKIEKILFLLFFALTLFVGLRLAELDSS